MAPCKSPLEPGTWGHTTFGHAAPAPLSAARIREEPRGWIYLFLLSGKIPVETLMVLQPLPTEILDMQVHVISEFYWLMYMVTGYWGKW